jgi:ketosteroid isomerase-like protein
LVAALGLVAFLLASRTAEQPTAVEEPDTTEADIAAIKEVVNAYHDTMEVEDLDAHIALFADDYQVHRDGESVVFGKEAIREVGIQSFEQYDWDFEFSSEEVQASVELGYYLGTYELNRFNQAGDSLTGFGSTMVILQRQADGTWKITRYMYNSRPREQE